MDSALFYILVGVVATIIGMLAWRATDCCYSLRAGRLAGSGVGVTDAR